jgi:adenylate cyclase
MDINRNDDVDKYPYQTILNLHESRISPDIIASQLDISKDDVIDVLKDIQIDNRNKEKSIVDASLSPELEMLNSNSNFDIESSIKDTQKRIWSKLKVKPNFNINLKNTEELLEKVVNTNIFLVILYADLVSSTKLSMNLPLKRLVPIIQSFTQEMSLIIDGYGGYVFKYVGDGILSFFFAGKDNLYLPCIKAVNCGHSMIKVIEEGINSILEENGYPELSIRVGIDVGENAVVHYGLGSNSETISEEEKNTKKSKNGTNSNQSDKGNKTNTIKKPLVDILGYTINTASKMTEFAKPNQIIIGNAVYEKLDNNKKKNFEKIHIDNESWNYIDNSTGNIYRLYGNLINKSL